MKTSGYWVAVESDKIVVLKAIFDETDLDPSANWKEAWQNQEVAGSAKGFVDLADALVCAAKMLASKSGQPFSSLEADKFAIFKPDWVDGRFEIGSLSDLFVASGHSIDSHSN